MPKRKKSPDISSGDLFNICVSVSKRCEKRLGLSGALKAFHRRLRQSSVQICSFFLRTTAAAAADITTATEPRTVAPQPDFSSALDSDSEAESAALTDSAAVPSALSDAAGADADSDSGSDTGSDSDSGSDTGSDSGSDTGSDSGWDSTGCIAS